MASASGSLSNGLGTYSADEDDDYEVRVTTTSTRRTSGSRSPRKTPSASTLRKRFENGKQFQIRNSDLVCFPDFTIQIF